MANRSGRLRLYRGCTVPGTHPPLLPPAPTNGQVASLSHGCGVVLGFTQQPAAVTKDAGTEPGTHHSDSLRQVAAWIAYPQHVDREGPLEELGPGPLKRSMIDSAL